MSASSMRLRRPGSERMLIVRVVVALGLALLLVIGAWSTSHGKADAHAALCLAPGVSAAPASGDHGGDIAVVDTAPGDSGLTAVAALCCVVLVLLFVRFGKNNGLLRTGVSIRIAAPPRAGPRLHVPALTLAQLSISRT